MLLVVFNRIDIEKSIKWCIQITIKKKKITFTSRAHPRCHFCEKICSEVIECEKLTTRNRKLKFVIYIIATCTSHYFIPSRHTKHKSFTTDHQIELCSIKISRSFNKIHIFRHEWKAEVSESNIVWYCNDKHQHQCKNSSLAHLQRTKKWLTFHTDYTLHTRLHTNIFFC